MDEGSKIENEVLAEGVGVVGLACRCVCVCDRQKERGRERGIDTEGVRER